MMWWRTRKTLNEYFSDYGLFAVMSPMLPPWHPSGVAGESLDELFFAKYGEKYVSNLIIRISQTAPFTENHIIALSGIILAQYRNKWQQLYDLSVLEYNPIENYNMVEREEFANNDETNRTRVTQGDVYGFNSTTPSPSTRETETEAGATVDRTGTRELTRSGNIGVTTSQQMIQSSIDLMNNWNFFENVFLDVDSILTIPIY